MLIALPKGRLLPEIKKLFSKIGIDFDENSRKLIIESSENYQEEIVEDVEVVEEDLDFVKVRILFQILLLCY